MSRILIKEAKKQESGEVNVAGFVRNLRLHKGLAFIDLVDITDSMQVVITENDASELFSLSEKLHLESVIEVSGTLQEKPAKKNVENPVKDFELLAKNGKLISLADENLPIPVLNKIDNEANIENRFDWRWLDLRQKEHQLIFKVWTKLEEGFRKYWADNNFIQLYTPSLMNTASESGSEVFEVKYFDKKAYLSQSPQFFKQAAMASGLEKVFICGPVFRAEASYTTRHVTEFTGWDMEISYIDYNQAMEVEEDALIEGFKRVKEDLGFDIEVPSKPFPKITLKEAKEKLAKKGIKSEKDFDFSTEEERVLGEIIKEEEGHDFVFVYDYPIEARPFYHMRHEDRPELTKSFDLIYRGLEITTGAEREHRVEYLEKQAKEKGMDIEELKDYINFFRYGCPGHSGLGIGPARIIMKMLGLPNVKEACFLPRDVKRLRP